MQLTKAAGESTKTSTTEPPMHVKASGGIRKLEDRKRAAAVSKNAEENNQNSKKEEVSAKATKKILDKEKKIEDLKKFASSMKLPTAIPADLVSVLSNDKHKQKELIQKQNDIVNKTTGSRKAVVTDQSSQQRASPSKESPSALPPPKLNSAQPQPVQDSDSNDKPAVSQIHQPYVPQPYYGSPIYGGLGNHSTQQGEPSIISRITMQLEFYFSTDNLVKDFNLRKHMDSQGFVFLFFIASLDRIQVLYASINVLRSLCINSDVIEIVKGDDRIERVRRKYGWQPWVLEISSRFPHARHDGPEKHVPVMSALQTYGYHLPTPQYGTQPPYGYSYYPSPYGQLHYPPRSDLGSPPSSTLPEYRPIQIASYPRPLGSQRPLQTYNNLMYPPAYPPYQPLSGGTQAQSASTKEPSTVLSPSQPSKPLNERPPTFVIPPKKSAAIVVNLPKMSQIGQAEKPKVRFASEPPKAPPRAPSSTQQNPPVSLGQSNSFTQANNASKNRPTPSTFVKQPQLNSPNQRLELPDVLPQIGKNSNKLEADTKIKGGRNSKPTIEASDSQNFGKFTTLALLDQSNTKGYSLPSRSLWSRVAALPARESPLGKPIDLDLDPGRPWSHEEDALLCIAYGETTPTNWKTISAMVGTRSQGQCKTRAKNLDRIMSPELRIELLKTVKEILQRKKNDAVSD
ncbi:hypothetical protein B0O99DRAFT_98532 [Bisporella sp. PMI_857]|nr:hypothetical protein B0O99DRAFT_98532 [Bisporella sp. PMI_857]